MNRMIAVPGCSARSRALFCNTVDVTRRGVLIVVILVCAVSVGTAEEPPPSAPYMVAFSPDGRRLAVATGKPDSKVALTVWDTGTLNRLWVVRDRQGIPAVAFAPDGQTLAIGCFSGWTEKTRT
jgi:WD40 repeat protein